jgi:phage-related protein
MSKEILLDATEWRTKEEFFEALAEALGSIEWHGRNADAFIETMVYHTDLNTVQPPYQLTVHNASGAVKEYVAKFASWVNEAKVDRKTDPEWGDEIEVNVELL